MDSQVGGLRAGHTGSVPNTDVHPDLRRIARIAPRRIVGRRTLPIVRALNGLRVRRRKPGASGDVEVVTLGSGVGVRLFRPRGVTEPAPALLWIHGGGYVIGTAQQDDRLCHQFDLPLFVLRDFDKSGFVGAATFQKSNRRYTYENRIPVYDLGPHRLRSSCRTPRAAPPETIPSAAWSRLRR